MEGRFDYFYCEVVTRRHSFGNLIGCVNVACFSVSMFQCGKVYKVYSLHFTFQDKVDSVYICITHIKPSHLRIRCRTLTRVTGGTCQCCFLRPRCGRIGRSVGASSSSLLAYFLVLSCL